ncbi:VCBS domain-containing protein, partial [Endozoicomonas sp. ISHI1]|uniref:VCBS domain-containing protein n=1 Tax=Endozoicomonas sp. ISHI1 TaxID=2825882 RepID=UPI0021484F5D
IQALGDGDSLTETVTVKSLDGTTHDIVITINGTNDAAVITGTDTGSVTEDAGNTLTTSGSLGVTDVDSGEAGFTAETITGTYGSLTIDGSGNWSYSASNSQAAIQSLADGDSLSETVTVKSLDGTTHDIVITINGTNDVAVISGTDTGSVTEDAGNTLSTSGSLGVTDVDSGEASFTAETITGSYGSLTIDVSGNWSYSASNSQAAIQSLGDGDSLSETVTVRSLDGTTHDIVITINGTNDAAVITGTDTGSVTEDAGNTLTTSGSLGVTDVDSGEASFTAETITGTYGSLTIDGSGNWSYSASNSQAAIQALGDGDSLSETVTVRSLDGTTHDIVITINGTNDAAVITGTDTGSVTEDAGNTLSTSGSLGVTDVDSGEASFTAETITGSYGSLTIDGSGNWSYSADNSQAAIQSLADGDSLSETVTVKSLDGTTHDIVITINGTNDAAVITGTDTGSVTEDAGNTLTTSGSLGVTDVDSGEASFTAETITGSYGSLTIDGSGNWSYSASNSQAAIQALGNGDSLSETVTVRSLDGTTHDIVITINGTNDAAVITGTDTGSVTEDAGNTLTTSGSLSVTDGDSGEASFTAETITGSYGSLTIDGSG